MDIFACSPTKMPAVRNFSSWFLTNSARREIVNRQKCKTQKTGLLNYRVNETSCFNRRDLYCKEQHSNRFPHLGSSKPLQEASATNQLNDKITIKTPIPKGRLFLKIELWRDLEAGVYLFEAPSPLLHTVQIHTPVLTHTGRGGGQPVRKLEGR